jgi:hypothetical protein
MSVDVARPERTSVARRVGPYVALSAVVFLIALWEHHVVFPAFSWNRDEPVYLWQMHTLRAGHFTVTDGGFPQFFQPWLSGHKDHVFFSQYTLGWPIVLLVGDVLGSPAFGIAFGALLAVLGTYALAREVTRDRAISFVAATVLFLSPIVPIQGGVFLGYLFTLGLGTLLAASALSGLRERRRWKLVVAGALLGWIFFTRPFDAVLWGLAVVGYVAFDRRRELRGLVSWAGWFALGLLPFVIVTVAYNKYITGSFTSFPITAADPLDKYGFGIRSIALQFKTTDYTIKDAVRSTGKNGFYVPLFLLGTYVGVLVAGWGLWLRRRERSSLLLLGMILIFPFGYFFFWGMHVSAINARMSGPIYFVPLYAPLAILMAHVLVKWWREKRGWGIALAVVLVLATIPFGWNRLQLNHHQSQAQRPWRHGADAVKDRGLVFVTDSGPYLLFLNPFSDNNAKLTDRVLFAVDREAENINLIERMSNRTPYRQSASYPGNQLGPTEDPKTPKIMITRLSIRRGGTITVTAHVTNRSGAPMVGAYVAFSDSAHRRHWRTIATSSTKGANYDVTWRLVPPGPSLGGATGEVNGSSTVPLSGKSGNVFFGAGFGATAKRAHTAAVEQLASYRIEGNSIALLWPPRKLRWSHVYQIDQWVPDFALPELAVDAKANAG